MYSPTILRCMRSLSKVYRLSSHDVRISSRTFTTLCSYGKTALPVVQEIPSTFFIQCRNYPKGKDRVKNKDKKVQIREDIMAEAIDVDKFKNDLQRAIDELKEQYIKQVSLRSAAGTIETLPLEFEGDKYTIQDLAQINRKNPKMLVLNFSSFPQTIPAVLDVLNNSGMNLHPQQDGTTIIIPIPKVTREHRENLVKGAKTLFNKCKDNIRHIQNQYVNKVEDKKSAGLSVDKVLIIKEQIMALAHQYTSQAEKIRDDKQKELMKED